MSSYFLFTAFQEELLLQYYNCIIEMIVLQFHILQFLFKSINVKTSVKCAVRSIFSHSLSLDGNINLNIVEEWKE
jgi:hypothetical protein